jgi:hypothetical protein
VRPIVATINENRGTNHLIFVIRHLLLDKLSGQKSQCASFPLLQALPKRSLVANRSFEN